MEYCGGGSVADIIAVTGQTLSEPEIAEVLAAMLLGLEYLHANRIIHRDVKAGNALLTEEGAAKLADFGVSAQLGSTMSRRRTVIGTPYWMSPEVRGRRNGALVALFVRTGLFRACGECRPSSARPAGERGAGARPVGAHSPR